MFKDLSVNTLYAKSHEGDWETVYGVICLCAISWTQRAITVFLTCLQLKKEAVLCTETHFRKFYTDLCFNFQLVSKLKCWLQNESAMFRSKIARVCR